MTDARHKRKEQNEALLAETQERVEQVRSVRSDFVCECDDPACMKMLPMTLEEYDKVRSRPSQAAVWPGHHDKEAERVVEANDRFFIVERFA